MNTSIKNILTPLLAIGSIVSVVDAADRYLRTDISSTDYNTADNWAVQSGGAGAVPVAGDTVFVAAGSTLDISGTHSVANIRGGMMYNGTGDTFGPEPTGVSNININSGASVSLSNNIFVGMAWNRDAGDANAVTTVDNGATLAVSANTLIGTVYNQNNSKNATGELIVNGGTVTTNNTMIGHKNNQNSSGTPTGTLTINSGSYTSANAITMGHASNSIGTLTVNGGTVNTKGLNFGLKDTGGVDYFGQTANFNLLGGEVLLTAAGWFNWDPDATVARNVQIGGGVIKATNQVTGTGYNAKLGTIRNLVSYMIANENGNQSLTIVGGQSAEAHSALLAQFSNGQNGQGGGTEQYEVDGGTLYLGYDDNTIASGATALWAVAAVPEPSSYALIVGFLAISSVITRRRR